MGRLGEALFFLALLLLGGVSLIVLIGLKLTGWAALPALVSGWGLWLTALILGTFVVIGLAGFARNLLQMGTSAERRGMLAQRTTDREIRLQQPNPETQFPGLPRDSNMTNSPGVTLKYRLPVARGASWHVAAAFIFAVVWNAVVGVLVVMNIGRHVAGEPEWLTSLFLAPFVAVGAWGIYYFLRQLLLTAGMGPTTLEVSDHPLYPDQTYEVFLSQAGHLNFGCLEMLLACDEETSFRQGTDVRSERVRTRQQQVFAVEQLEIKPGAPFERRCQLHVPADVMHSFQSQHNAIQWQLVVKGDPDGWPSFERSFPVVVYPASEGETAG